MNLITTHQEAWNKVNLRTRNSCLKILSCHFGSMESVLFAKNGGNWNEYTITDSF